MMYILSWLLFCLGVASQQFVLPVATSADPVPPSRDPWYTAPAGWESAAPGDVLRIRSTPGNLTSSVVDKAAAAYHILYRTTNSLYKPSWAVTTLYIPKSLYVSPSGNKGIVSYQVPYDSAYLDSSPSYGLYYEFAQAVPSLGIPSTTDIVNQLLEEGWLANIPDYEGPTAAFGAGIQAGHATLDSLRAIQNIVDLSGFGNITIALWGYSGGTIATEAASEMQAQYAPELNIHGAVWGGLPTFFANNFDLFSSSPLSGDLVSILLGVTSLYPEARKYLTSRLQPANGSIFMNALNTDVSTSVSYFADQDIYSYFIGGADDLKAPVMQKIYNSEMRLGYNGVPTMPIFAYKAIGDEYCPIKDTDAIVNKFCGAGAEITYQRNTVGGHVAELVNGKPRAIDWLRGIINETYVSSGCSTTEVTVDIAGIST
ncbi:hypothetical protein M426DRAFT_25899 [Hypoxylon sp. CI-4A]|nr:hypothetical protein M426DRAFT_25899 [Hypoxylon sp. CI-4A]